MVRVGLEMILKDNIPLFIDIETYLESMVIFKLRVLSLFFGNLCLRKMSKN
jgi:hypothetical protein